MEIQRNFVNDLNRGLLQKPFLIQVVLGPRQVGKTTGVKQLLKKTSIPHFYVSADGDVLKHPSWILEQWQKAKKIAADSLLIIDEIQKVENWAETIKKLWDEQNLKSNHIKVILLGSSSLQLQKGLSESLTGRFLLHKVYHWDFEESRSAYKINLDQYLRYGGYPASYGFLEKRSEWLNYVQNSIIDTVIGKDILSIARVKSPSLFKQSFHLACSYACQEISYTKLLGQLQDKGNTELVKYYLELFEQAFLLKQLYKYSNKKVLARASSPKILPLCPALYSVTIDADYSDSHYERAFELRVGMKLAQFPGELFYWRQANLEVDYVLKYGRKLWAIEVKLKDKSQTKALYEFKKQFSNATIVTITQDNFNQELKAIQAEAE